MTGLPPGGGGWLSALAGPQLGAALRLIRGHPGTAWTVARLAARAGGSGSAFAARFTRLAGRAPVQYLTCWRVQHAQRLLRAANAGIAQIAAHVGCQAGPAVSRAFKRWAGMAPGACRRGR